MQTITFLLPNAADRPVGGYKVVYEYANRLVRDGYQVNIVYGVAGRPVRGLWLRMAYRTVRAFRWMKYRWFVNFRPDAWFQTDPKVRHILRYDFAKHRMPESDFYVATAWSTAPWVAQYPIEDRTRKLYFIQSFEDWATSKEEVIETWKLPLTKIVIAPWLKEIAEKLGEEAALIKNGFDMDRFRLTVPIEQKDALRVIMLWHDHPLKGCRDGLEALMMVHEKYPRLRATFFGVPSRPSDLPDWVDYYCRPLPEQLNELYNEAAVYIGPSHIEGFALTPAEAMLCGCAVCATDIGGYTVICHHEQTALLAPVGEPGAMADNVGRLIEHPEWRIRLATQANLNIRNYTWEIAYEKFKSMICSCGEKHTDTLD